MKIPATVRNLALRHKLNIGRDEFGYYINVAGVRVESTRASKPTAANAVAMIKRYLRVVPT